jgi:hypothetical protein
MVLSLPLQLEFPDQGFESHLRFQEGQRAKEPYLCSGPDVTKLFTLVIS